jgi:hypothetical protein
VQVKKERLHQKIVQQLHNQAGCSECGIEGGGNAISVLARLPIPKLQRVRESRFPNFLGNLLRMRELVDTTTDLLK